MELKEIIERMKDPVEYFPVILGIGNISEERRETYIECLKKSADYLEAGSIPNPRFKEQSDRMNRFAEHAFDDIVEKAFYAHPDFGKDQDTPVIALYKSMNSSNLTGIGSSIKKLSKFLKESPELASDPLISAAVSVFSELNILCQAADTLRATAQKRVQKTEADREAEAKYIPPVANKAALEMVRVKLQEITENLFQGLIESRINNIQSRLDQAMFKSSNGAKYDDYSPGQRAALRKYARRESSMPGSKHILLPNHKDLILEHATQDATLIRDAFIIKNLRKLASIIDKKNNLSDIQIVAQSVSLAAMEGTLQINFRDNSSFQVNNQVVFVENSFGTEFYRYPLTFREVVMPDGSRPSRPSEKFMNLSF